MSDNNNGDVCVSDSNANTVVVVDKTGRVRFRYNGTPARREISFAPRGIVTDAFSQIIVADRNNKCLHILDQNGQFLRCVDDCRLDCPHGLSVDSEGRLWFVIEYFSVLDFTDSMVSS
ncbi:protein brain tumor-like [Crassostrea virginica]